MSKFVQSDRHQPFLLPPDLRDWLPPDDLAHFIIEAVERVPMSHFKVNVHGTGSAQYHPQMMLGLLIYCYANGIFSSRKIERASYRDIGVRYMTANCHPDHDTIARFRRENLEAISASFLQVLLLAKELKVLKVGRVSVDGTKLKANASKRRSIRYDRAQQLRTQLQGEIDEILNQAAQADDEGLSDDQRLPEALSRRSSLKSQLDQACRRLERQARDRADRDQADYEAKVKARDARSGKRKGKKIKPPSDTPKADEQINLTDPDAKLMRKSKASGYHQSYNAQAVVDADGSQLVLGSRVSQCASDRNELVADIQAIPEQVGEVKQVLADNGYANAGQVAELERLQMDVLVAVGGGDHRRRYDFRPEPDEPIQAKEPKADWLQQMKAKLEDDVNRKSYQLRQHTVEPVFGIVKHVLGFRQFLLRGHAKVSSEWELLMLAYNCKRIHKLKQA